MVCMGMSLVFVFNLSLDVPFFFGSSIYTKPRACHPFFLIITSFLFVCFINSLILALLFFFIIFTFVCAFCVWFFFLVPSFSSQYRDANSKTHASPALSSNKTFC